MRPNTFTISRLAAAAGAIPGARRLAFDVTDHAAARAAIDGDRAETAIRDMRAAMDAARA